MLRIRPFAEIRPFGKFTGFLMKGCKVDTASKFEGHLGPRYIYTLYIYIYICTYHVCLYIILHECMQSSFKMSGHATYYWNYDPNRQFFQNMRKQYYFIVHIY